MRRETLNELTRCVYMMCMDLLCMCVCVSVCMHKITENHYDLCGQFITFKLVI